MACTKPVRLAVPLPLLNVLTFKEQSIQGNSKANELNFIFISMYIYFFQRSGHPFTDLFECACVCIFPHCQYLTIFFSTVWSPFNRPIQLFFPTSNTCLYFLSGLVTYVLTGQFSFYCSPLPIPDCNFFQRFGYSLTGQFSLCFPPTSNT